MESLPSIWLTHFPRPPRPAPNMLHVTQWRRPRLRCKASPVINHTAKAPKENYLKRHYNKFKAIWNLGLARIQKKFSQKKNYEKGTKESGIQNRIEREDGDWEGKLKKNKCFGHFIMRIIHCCNGLSLCRSQRRLSLFLSLSLCVLLCRQFLVH